MNIIKMFRANPSQSYTFASHTSQRTDQSLQKSMPAQQHIHSNTTDRLTTKDRRAACNTGLAKVAVQWSADTFVVNKSLVLRINICGQNRHLRQAPNRYLQPPLKFCIKSRAEIQLIFIANKKPNLDLTFILLMV